MAIQTKQLLMIAYYFPPLGGAGVQRSAKFAKYLACLGWQVKVVSVVPPAFEPLDVTLEAEVNRKGITVERVPYRAKFRQFDKLPGGWRLRAVLEERLLFPDRMEGWLAPALAVARKIVEQNPGIVIFSTSAPYTAHLIARELKRRYGNPWVADFRDEWSQNPYQTITRGYRFRRCQKAEQTVLNEADIVISVTETITAGLKQIVPEAAGSFFTIPNGFDPEDFRELKALASQQWTLTHVGTLNQAREALLIPLIQMLKGLIARNVISDTDVKLRLIGVGDWHNPEFTGLSWLEVQGYLPHSGALAAMKQCNMAILAEANPAAFTGKVFEYLGLQKPILGLVHPESPAARLIREAQAGWVVGLEANQELAEALCQSYQDWRNGENHIRPRPEVIARFNREQQAAELVRIITEHL
jgi:glycosyltransferase involved in cell wall biosynthesis